MSGTLLSEITPMHWEKDNPEFEKFTKVTDGLMAVPYKELLDLTH